MNKSRCMTPMSSGNHTTANVLSENQSMKSPINLVVDMQAIVRKVENNAQEGVTERKSNKRRPSNIIVRPNSSI